MNRELVESKASHQQKDIQVEEKTCVKRSPVGQKEVQFI
jgi:hypothetical protein